MLAIAAHSRIFSSRASGTPKAMFSRMVSLKRKVSCGHVADGVAKRVERIIANRPPIDKQRASRRLPESRDECRERRLAAPGGPHDRERRSGRHMEVDISQNGSRFRSGRIGERQVAEFDFAADCIARNGWRQRDPGARLTVPIGAWGWGDGGIVDIGFGAQNIEQTAHRGGTALKDVRDPAKRDDGEDQLPEERVKGHESTERYAMIDYGGAAPAKKDHSRHADESHESRKKQAPGSDQLDVALDVIPVDAIEGFDFRLFLRIGANDANAREIFLRARGKRAQSGLDPFRKPVNDPAEVIHGDDYKRHRQQDPQRETRGQLDHEIEREDACGNRVGRVHDARAEHHADGVEVISGARHQVARAVADIEFRLEFYQPGEQIIAQVVFDLARDSDQNPSRPEREKSFHNHRHSDRDAIKGQCAMAVRRVESENRMQDSARRADQGRERARQTI